MARRHALDAPFVTECHYRFRCLGIGYNEMESAENFMNLRIDLCRRLNEPFDAGMRTANDEYAAFRGFDDK